MTKSKIQKIIIELDSTPTIESNAPYEEKLPNRQVVETCWHYRKWGFLLSFLQLATCRALTGTTKIITKHKLPVILGWLSKHHVPYRDVIIGKPWCGSAGFYVDDKAIRPNEFISKNFQEVSALVGID